MNKERLVEKMRHCATDPMPCLSCNEVNDGRCFKRLMMQAADVIEELSKQLKKQEDMLRAEWDVTCDPEYRESHFEKDEWGE